MKISQEVNLVTESCCVCGMTFAMPDWLKRRAKNDSAVAFYCPNGHSMSYKKSELDRTREMLEQANKKSTDLAAIIAQEQKEKAKAYSALKNQTKRIHAGVCPCCNRTFKNLARHMASKHKD